MRVLSGVKVLDFTHYISGPYCGQILSDYGAEVIKVEQIGGERGRTAPPLLNDESLYFAAQNRNKRSLSLNLKTDSGKEIVEKLIRTSDILITNYGAGVPERLGIDFDSISKINPKISMVHITGFGLTGPYKEHTAYDGIIQSMSGIASLTGQPGNPPTLIGSYMADQLAGLQGAMGAMLALFHKERTGRGKYVDVSMLDGMLSMLSYVLTEYMVNRTERPQIGNRDPRSFSNMYPTKDGFIFMAPLTQKMWEKLCELIDKEEWALEDSPFFTREARMENREYLEEAIAEWTKQYTKEDAFQLLQQAGVASGPVNTLEDIVNNPQVKNRSMLRKMKLTKDGSDEIYVNGVPIKVQDEEIEEFTPPPSLGEHSKEILQELGFTESEVEKFSKAGVIE